MNRNNIIIPSFRKPNTVEEAFRIAEELVREAWDDFSKPYKSPKSLWGLLGGHAFLSKRIKGHEWHTSQSLCWLRGQGVLTSKELIIALGRNPVVLYDGKLQEQTTGFMRSNPSSELIYRIQSYALEIYPTLKYEKKGRFYDEGLPGDSLTPYIYVIYVIEDIKGDIKIGISTKPKNRFRAIECHESTTIKQYYCSMPISHAYVIEQAALKKYGRGKHPTKKSLEWLWEVSFEEIKAHIINQQAKLNES